MGWYEMAKDAISIAQKADNIELVKNIMDLQQQMMDMQEENRVLKDQIRKLQTSDEIESKLIRHNGPYYSLQYGGVIENICAPCWNEHHIKINLNNLFNGYFKCPKCSSEGRYEGYRDDD